MLFTAAMTLLALPPEAAWAPGGRSQPEDLVISVVTFGPADDLPSLWGHTALVVVDKRLELGRLYNYGAFDFSPGFVTRFLAGRLEFHIEEAGIMGIYAEAREQDRSITVQELSLTPEQALRAANALAVNVLPDNSGYLYHHFDDNCSTRARDLLDRALEGALSRATSGPARTTLRQHMLRYAQEYPPVALWLDFMQNDQLDRPITVRDEAFLPDELARALDQLVLDGRPAVKQTTKLYVSKTMPVTPGEPPRWAGWLALCSSLAGGAVLGLRRTRGRAARIALGALLALEGLVWGVCGVLAFVLGTFTNNLVFHHNENLFLINPATLALLPLGVMLMRDSPRAAPALKWLTVSLATVAVAGLAVKLLPGFEQQNGPVIAMVLPLSLATALAFSLPAQRQR